MGLFGKYNKMTYDEALNLLMDGMVPTAVLKAAFKCVCKSKQTMHEQNFISV